MSQFFIRTTKMTVVKVLKVTENKRYLQAKWLKDQA